ncbi:MAG: SHOCT domain-containing protein [Nitrolancea sp.]
MQVLSSLPLLVYGPDHPWVHHAGFWPWAPLVFGFFWILIFAAFAFTISMFARRGWHRHMPSADPGGHDRARAILAERFARGEISAEEYDERVSHLA